MSLVISELSIILKFNTPLRRKAHYSADYQQYNHF